MSQAPMTQKSLSEFESSGVECPTCGRSDFEKEGHMKIHHKESHGESIAGVAKSCTQCGTDFRRRESVETDSDKEFCSQECYHTWNEETGALAGENNPLYKEPVSLDCEQCGCGYEVPPVHSDSRFCSAECRYDWLSEQTGEDHPLYQGGHDYYTAIRRSLSEVGWETLRNRHNGDVCEMCGAKTSPHGRDLSLHHIVPILSGGTNGKYNFMTLCEPCHSTVESFCSDLPGFDRVLVE